MTCHRNHWLARLILLALLVAPAATVHPQKDFNRAPDAPLRPGDALLIRIDNFGGRLPAYREIIDRDGDIELPFLGMLAADGKTIPALQEEMAAAYAEARLASNATVTISYITHFDPPPDRATLVRTESPRIPVPAPAAFPVNSED
ncbi:MAG: polysaccharide biosynthesis/export family protein [Kiritimatiellia bacterium]|jgi:protein involved in polysaccharide export with SLBB domain|nr:polysaccharide biosynthesis/export family protein [Kiritimatiellia bacterium]